MDDKELVSLIVEQGKVDEGFRVLLKTYQERVYWHIRKMVYDHDDANDIAQNTFIKIYKNLNKFKGDSKLYSWIYRIATNEAITFINQKKKRDDVSFEDVSYSLAQNLEADEFFDGDEIEVLLQQCIAQLPEQQRLVFQMKYFDDMKYEEIAEVLQKSIGGLKANYHHAVKKIKELLEMKTVNNQNIIQ
ncbi:RNA polymerase sigma-H factor [Flavobacteriaceae bacterium UJ101]|nr:RNA polymerase sigma-H factor [Flavobacteriaceae bacterium UJ101]